MSENESAMGVRTTSEKSYREAFWNELQIEQKIERMREIVKRQERDIENLVMNINKLRNHAHNDFGLLMIPFDSSSGEPSRQRYDNKEDKYF